MTHQALPIPLFLSQPPASFGILSAFSEAEEDRTLKKGAEVSTLEGFVNQAW